MFFKIDEPRLGFRIHTSVQSDLTSKAMLGRDLPGGPPKSDAVLVSIDSVDGLTLGDGKDHRILLPFHAGSYHAEIRDLTLAVPEQGEGASRFDVSATVAGRFGPVIGLVAQGIGIIVRWRDDGDGFEVLPKPPEGLGVKVEAGIVKGGGYIRYREAEGDYAGILDIDVGPVRATAIGLFDPDPVSFVVVIGIRFTPAIELGFGFTLNGVGGLFAFDRGFSETAVRDALSAGVVSNLLFPDDPIAIAPTILTQLEALFPYQAGSFVVGPIAELGWGSQTGLVRAKIGVLLALPGEGSLTILGALSITVPPKIKGVDKFKVIDLNVESLTRIDADSITFYGELRNSFLANLSIDGQMRGYIAWGGDPYMAISAGGFYPGYEVPAPLAKMKLISVKLDPPIKGVTFNVSGYAALTANSVQWGGKARLEASIGPVHGEAELSVDALFQWAPAVHFAIGIHGHVSIEAFDQRVASVRFDGELSGVHPWRLYGYASVGILFWDAELPVGPVTWGQSNEAPPAAVSPVAAVVEALSAPTAWTPLLPIAGDTLVTFRPVETDETLVHPLATFEVRQLTIPLEIEIDRVGPSPVSTRRVNLANPTVNGMPAAAASQVDDRFAIGQFLNLSDEDKVGRPDFEVFAAGARIAASHGAEAPPEVVVEYAWDTVFPHEGGRLPNAVAMELAGNHVLATAAAEMRRRATGNPYRRPHPIAAIKIAEPGLKKVATIDTLEVAVPGFVTTAEAARTAAGLAAAVQLVGMGAIP